MGKRSSFLCCTHRFFSIDDDHARHVKIWQITFEVVQIPFTYSFHGFFTKPPPVMILQSVLTVLKCTLKADATFSLSFVKCILNEHVRCFTPCVSVPGCFHGSPRPGATALTWGHPGIWRGLLSGVGLFPVKVIVPALAVPTRWQRPLKITIACEKRKTFILLLQLFY